MNPKDANRTKVNLKLSENRIQLLMQKKNTINKTTRKEISLLLENEKTESALVKVEHVIREDTMVEVYELISLYCETLLARFQLLVEFTHCEPGILEAVATLIYSAPRLEIPELLVVRDLLIKKFGAEFSKACMDNNNDVVSSKVLQKIRSNTPSLELKTLYLGEIAKAYNVAWEQPNTLLLSNVATPLLHTNEKTFIFPIVPPIHSDPIVKDNGPINNSKEAEFDILAKRFEQLKKRT